MLAYLTPQSLPWFLTGGVKTFCKHGSSASPLSSVLFVSLCPPTRPFCLSNRNIAIVFPQNREARLLSFTFEFTVIFFNFSKEIFSRSVQPTHANHCYSFERNNGCLIIPRPCPRDTSPHPGCDSRSALPSVVLFIFLFCLPFVYFRPFISFLGPIPRTESHFLRHLF